MGRNSFGNHVKTSRKDFMKGQPDWNKTVAFCHNHTHVGRLSLSMLKKHDCLQKQCPYLTIYTDHPYWSARAAKKRQQKFKHWLENNDWDNISAYLAESLIRAKGGISEDEFGYYRAVSLENWEAVTERIAYLVNKGLGGREN